MKTIAGRLVDEPRSPGEFAWLMDMDGERMTYMQFCCPGCGREGTISIRPSSDPESWAWDGDREKPTLSPSINCVGCCGWHAYLTKGVFGPRRPRTRRT